MSLDVINGFFEAGGALCIWLNVRQLLRDKKVRGVFTPVTGFFWAWGLFNLVYYPSLGQWFSFAGGCMITLANTAWLVLAIKYRRQ